MHEDFDNKIKLKCQLEPDIISEDYKEKLKTTLNNLPIKEFGAEKFTLEKRESERRFKSISLVASILIIVLIATFLCDKINYSHQIAKNRFDLIIDETKAINGILITIKDISVKDDIIQISTIIESNNNLNDIIKKYDMHGDYRDLKSENFIDNLIPITWISINGSNFSKYLNTNMKVISDNQVSFNQEFLITDRYIEISNIYIQIRNAFDLGYCFNFEYVFNEHDYKVSKVFRGTKFLYYFS